MYLMNRVKRMAKTLMEKYHTNDPFFLCEREGIHVIYQDLPERIRGFYMMVLDKRVIILNQDLDEDTVRWVLAHELGHCCLHPDLNSLDIEESTNLVTAKYEQEADLFVYYLLVNMNELYDEYGQDCALTMENIANFFHLPVEIIQLGFLFGK